jgi:FkbM family methyltransferase
MTEQEINGIIREVLTNDCYRIGSLRFIPDVVFDIGANVGVFSRLVSNRFPEALIVAVEPDENNLSQFLLRDNPRIKILNNAIGVGTVWHLKQPENSVCGGAQECYHTVMPGYTEEYFESSGIYERSKIESISLDTLVGFFVDDNEKYMVKIDCEGAENSIFSDERSLQALKGADYISAEIHGFGIGETIHPLHVKEYFDKTHLCSIVDNMFFATKRTYENKFQP